jgi:hypothetical protein
MPGLGKVPRSGIGSRCRGWGCMARNGEKWCDESRGVEYTKAARTWRLEGWEIGKGLHELGYREDHNLTLEYGVN